MQPATIIIDTVRSTGPEPMLIRVAMLSDSAEGLQPLERTRLTVMALGNYDDESGATVVSA